MENSVVPQKFNAQITVKVTAETLAKFKKIEAKHGLNPSDALRRLGDAMLAFYEQYGFFSFPVKMEPEEGWLMRAAELAAEQNRQGALEAAKRAALQTPPPAPLKQTKKTAA